MITSPDDIPAFAQNLYVCSCLPSLMPSFSGAESDVLIVASRKHPKNKPSYWRSWMLTGPRRRDDALMTQHPHAVITTSPHIFSHSEVRFLVVVLCWLAQLILIPILSHVVVRSLNVFFPLLLGLRPSGNGKFTFPYLFHWFKLLLRSRKGKK